MRVYIAGPMRGLPEFGFPAFDEAAAALSAAGHQVVSPAQHDRDNGFDPTGMNGREDLTDHGFDLRDALTWDLAQVTQAQAVMLLPGWRHSSGARAEIATAAAVGILASEDGHTWAPAATFLTEPTPPAAAGGEVRVTNEKTGGQKGRKLARMDLIPVGALTALAEHYGRGAAKYEDNQWRKGYDWSLSYGALMRHVTTFWGGEDIDEETGSPHMAAVAWHAFTLLTFAVEHPDLDDRPHKAPTR